MISTPYGALESLNGHSETPAGGPSQLQTSGGKRMRHLIGILGTFVLLILSATLLIRSRVECPAPAALQTAPVLGLTDTSSGGLQGASAEEMVKGLQRFSSEPTKKVLQFKLDGGCPFHEIDVEGPECPISDLDVAIHDGYLEITYTEASENCPTPTKDINGAHFWDDQSNAFSLVCGPEDNEERRLINWREYFSLETPGLITYGKWCGRLHTHDDPAVPCNNDVDCACRAHDLCLRAEGYHRCGCDNDFIQNLESANCPDKGCEDFKNFAWFLFQIKPCSCKRRICGFGVCINVRRPGWRGRPNC
mmetsp:Transcript_17205/g.65672  ORF Transcript_17205/g.65672 Transcript_17205/m.65672 type:complete len:306 (-) Transcript_17205:256-1173(-)|eukprot:scaffold116_cov233-Pinguiococcus_pyrenoidosus.AAC.10